MKMQLRAQFSLEVVASSLRDAATHEEAIARLHDQLRASYPDLDFKMDLAIADPEIDPVPSVTPAAELAAKPVETPRPRARAAKPAKTVTKVALPPPEPAVAEEVVDELEQLAQRPEPVVYESDLAFIRRRGRHQSKRTKKAA